MEFITKLKPSSEQFQPSNIHVFNLPQTSIKVAIAKRKLLGYRLTCRPGSKTVVKCNGRLETAFRESISKIKVVQFKR